MIRSNSTIQRLPPQKATDPDLIAIRAKLLNALAVKASTLATPQSSRAASPGATSRLRSRRPAHSPSPRVVVGPNAINLLPAELASLRLSSPLIVSSPSRLKIARKIQAIIPNLDTRILSSAVITMPTRISGRDCVISVGGGSAVTLARAVSLRKGIPHICIPTTFSGSEMIPESSIPVPRERGGSEGSNSRAVREIARESKTLPAVIIYDDDLTTSSSTRFSAPSDEDIMEDRAEPHPKSGDACWSYLNLPGV
ncbi:Fe-ADH domain-containing protein [Fusarium sp. LHS14.1]|nr:Fe-ADH domain-containing protein [Fusarium sp. LHS14.1]